MALSTGHLSDCNWDMIMLIKHEAYADDITLLRLKPLLLKLLKPLLLKLLQLTPPASCHPPSSGSELSAAAVHRVDMIRLVQSATGRGRRAEQRGTRGIREEPERNQREEVSWTVGYF